MEQALRAQIADLERRLADACAVCCSNCRSAVIKATNAESLSFFASRGADLPPRYDHAPSLSSLMSDSGNQDISRLSVQALEMLAIFEDDTAPISVDLLDPPTDGGIEAPALATFSKTRAEWSLERSSSRNSVLASHTSSKAVDYVANWSFGVIWMVCQALSDRDQKSLACCSKKLAHNVKAFRAQADRLKAISQFRAAETKYVRLLRHALNTGRLDFSVLYLFEKIVCFSRSSARADQWGF